MSSDVIGLDHEIATIVEVVERRTIAFFNEQLAMVADRLERRVRYEQSAVLRSLTAIVAVGSRAGLYIAYSYDDSLIRAMTKRYTAGLTIPPGEEDLYVQETASDIVNVIVGNCTADLAQRGELISLSPPMLMAGARTIRGRSETTIAALTLSFPEGALDVAFVGPKLLFDDQLNYREGVS